MTKWWRVAMRMPVWNQTPVMMNRQVAQVLKAIVRTKRAILMHPSKQTVILIWQKVEKTKCKRVFWVTRRRQRRRVRTVSSKRVEVVHRMIRVMMKVEMKKRKKTLELLLEENEEISNLTWWMTISTLSRRVVSERMLSTSSRRQGSRNSIYLSSPSHNYLLRNKLKLLQSNSNVKNRRQARK